MNKLLTCERLRKSCPLLFSIIKKKGCVWVVTMGRKFCPSKTIKKQKSLSSVPLTPPEDPEGSWLPVGLINPQGVVESWLQTEVLGWFLPFLWWKKTKYCFSQKGKTESILKDHKIPKKKPRRKKYFLNIFLQDEAYLSYSAISRELQ